MSTQVLLVAMPWEMLEFPSIQLGTLESLLRREGVSVSSRSSKLLFWEHCLEATKDDPPGTRLQLQDYDAIALSFWDLGLGDWIFAPESPGYAAYLTENGVPDEVIDKSARMRELVPAFLEQECAAILAAEPAIVGFTSAFNQNLPSLALARLLKAQAPGIAVIMGGANCEGPMGAAALRAFECIDVVVRGEAEAVLPGLVQEVLHQRPITRRPGLCFRENGDVVVVPEAGRPRVAMDDVPLPCYDEYFETLATTRLHADIRPRVTLLYESARGCWWGEKSTCTFCGLNGANMTFRRRDPAQVEENLHSLAAKHRRLSFQIVDNILAPDYFHSLLPRLAEAEHDFGLFLETKSNLSWPKVQLLRRAGVTSMQTGIESLSTSILTLMCKGVSALHNIRTLVYCQRAGIRAYWNLLYGFPGEDPDEYARMAETIPALSHLQPPSTGRLRLDRFSPYHTAPDRFGLRVGGPTANYAMLYPQVPPDLLAELAYTFDYALPSGQEPDDYVQPLLSAVQLWQDAQGTSLLTSRRGPDFLLIDDQRAGLEPAHYTLGPLGRRIYEACEHGATTKQVAVELQKTLGSTPGLDQVQAFLDELAQLRLLYREGKRYLGLAIPQSESAGQISGRLRDAVALDAVEVHVQ